MGFCVEVPTALESGPRTKGEHHERDPHDDQEPVESEEVHNHPQATGEKHTVQGRTAHREIEIDESADVQDHWRKRDEDPPRRIARLGNHRPYSDERDDSDADLEDQREKRERTS
jgi:hypothetical protein